MYPHTNPDTRARGARTMQKNSEKNEKKATFLAPGGAGVPPNRSFTHCFYNTREVRTRHGSVKEGSGGRFGG